MANPDAFDEQRVGDAMPEPNPASRVVGDGGADPGDATPEPNPASRVVGDGGAEPVVPNVPNVTLPMLIEWCRIGNCYRRDELVYIQLRDNDVVHGFTLNERNDLHYFWEHPNGVTTYLPFPLPIRMVISPEIGYEYGSCKLIIGNDSALGLDKIHCRVHVLRPLARRGGTTIGTGGSTGGSRRGVNSVIGTSDGGGGGATDDGGGTSVGT